MADSTEVSVEVAAGPTTLYEMVSDVTRMGEWSPETVSGEWLDGAAGPAVGARFKGRNKRGFVRWSTKPVVGVADPGRAFAVVVEDLTRWSYALEADGAGTRLTESFEMLDDLPWYFRFADRYIMRIPDRAADLERAMGETIGRIKVAVERTPSA